MIQSLVLNEKRVNTTKNILKYFSNFVEKKSKLSLSTHMYVRVSISNDVLVVTTIP